MFLHAIGRWSCAHHGMPDHAVDHLELKEYIASLLDLIVILLKTSLALSSQKLTFFKDKGRIFKHVKNINKDPKIGVADDYLKEVEQMRKALLPVLKKAKQEKK